MKKYTPLLLPSLLVAGTTLAIVLVLWLRPVAVLEPMGVIAREQRDILLFACILSVVVVLPVFVLAGVIAWRYRHTNKKARYRPQETGNTKLEALWWGIPCAIIAVLAVVAWQTSYSLDPYRPVAAAKPPLKVQVVALPWKWLFIYPEERIATVNTLTLPVDRPIEFSITADAPMNSFWIPQLGGQVYAMSGMQTKLHLMADRTGTLRGSSANISGEGFADMHFPVSVVSEGAFRQWAQTSRRSPLALNTATYTALALPSKAAPAQVLRLHNQQLFNEIIATYMAPQQHRDTPLESLRQRAAQGSTY